MKVGQKVFDRWYPQQIGTVQKVLKTRVHVYFPGNIRHTSYDRAHAREFLEKAPRKKR